MRETVLDLLHSSIGADERRREWAPLTKSLINLLASGRIDAEYARSQKWYLQARLHDFARVYDFQLTGIGLSQKAGVARFEVRIAGERDQLLSVLPASFRGIEIAYDFVSNIELQSEKR